MSEGLFIKDNNVSLGIYITRCSGVLIVNFEHISHLFRVFLLFNLNK